MYPLPISGEEWKLDDGRAKKLMKVAAWLSPEVLVFTSRWSFIA
jgi:hypothetical protein